MDLLHSLLHSLNMHLRTALLWSQLNILTKGRYDAIMQVYGSLDDAEKHVGEELLRGLGCKEETVRAALMRMEEFDVEQVQQEMDAHNVQCLTLEDEQYPRRLREIGDPPVFLYYRGDLSILDQPTVAVVGTRRMSQYGRRVAQDFVPTFVRAGLVIVSGLALGIDAEAAEETIKAKGKTVAVLGHGLSTIYPASNRKLSEMIVKSGGLLMTEFPMRMEPEKFTFPARNRIIAGLSIATVVLEAPEGSGSVITAELALEYNREVFAVPGQIFDSQYAGCHQLLRRGQAHIAVSTADVLEEMGVIAPSLSSQPVYQPQNSEEEAVLQILSSMPQSIDSLAEKSRFSVGTLSATLTILELSGAVRNVGAGQWIKLSM